MVTEVLFKVEKRPEREVNHSPESSAKVRNGSSYISTPPTCLHGVERGNFTKCPNEFLISLSMILGYKRKTWIG
jgi:hypothetical protein